MRRILPAFAVLLAWAGAASAHGLLIPEDKKLPPLAMLNHKVTIAVEDQIAITRVEQTFRNHTDRELEATYVFPVPKGASTDKFTMWINGKETAGEVLDSKHARDVYTSIVRRTQDPGLLEYIGNNLFRMRVFPIPAHGDQKVAVRFTSVAPKESNLVEYIYPLKTDGKATATLEEFSITATIKSQHGVTNVYSPTHAVTVKRATDKEVTVTFDRNQGLLDKDFQLFYSLTDKDVGLTALTHRPISSENGYFTLLVSPNLEASKKYQVPRDVVMVLDTSGSMRGVKMDQAKKALKYCLSNLNDKDRFGVLNFATTVNTYRDNLVDANSEHVGAAQKWADNLEATGGTAINDALAKALTFRSNDDGRTFTVIFFTDGQPTIGETNPEKIFKNTLAANTGNTRIFTFGVGDDVNATLLDRLAEDTRALSTYVRPAEDIETKVSGLYSKISNPVLANLKLTTTGDVSLNEVYPTQLPDLFYGSQLVVLGRYTGKGPAAIKLTGQVGKETKEFVYEMNFPDKTTDERVFVEHLWARRKVGFLLDQIRVNGEKKEVVDEVVSLSKKYGITTPYTSWLIVPDGTAPVVSAPEGRPKLDVGFGGVNKPVPPPALAPAPGGVGGGTGAPGPISVEDFARKTQAKPGDIQDNRGRYADKELEKQGDGKGGDKDDPNSKRAAEAKEKKDAYDQARGYLNKGERDAVQKGKLGVDLSVQMQNLRNQTRLEQTANRQAYGRNCIEIGGVWIDEGFDAKTKTLVVKAQSDAYFKLLDKQPKLKEVFQLGNHLVWVAPNGVALVIDMKEGKDKLTDKEIEELFVAKK